MKKFFFFFALLLAANFSFGQGLADSQLKANWLPDTGNTQGADMVFYHPDTAFYIVDTFILKIHKEGAVVDTMNTQLPGFIPWAITLHPGGDLVVSGNLIGKGEIICTYNPTHGLRPTWGTSGPVKDLITVTNQNWPGIKDVFGKGVFVSCGLPGTQLYKVDLQGNLVDTMPVITGSFFHIGIQGYQSVGELPIPGSNVTGKQHLLYFNDTLLTVIDLPGGTTGNVLYFYEPAGNTWAAIPNQIPFMSEGQAIGTITVDSEERLIYSCHLGLNGMGRFVVHHGPTTEDVFTQYITQEGGDINAFIQIENDPSVDSTQALFFTISRDDGNPENCGTRGFLMSMDFSYYIPIEETILIDPCFNKMNKDFQPLYEAVILSPDGRYVYCLGNGFDQSEITIRPGYYLEIKTLKDHGRTPPEKGGRPVEKLLSSTDLGDFDADISGCDLGFDTTYNSVWMNDSTLLLAANTDGLWMIGDSCQGTQIDSGLVISVAVLDDECTVAYLRRDVPDTTTLWIYRCDTERSQATYAFFDGQINVIKKSYFNYDDYGDPAFVIGGEVAKGQKIGSSGNLVGPVTEASVFIRQYQAPFLWGFGDNFTGIINQPGDIWEGPILGFNPVMFIAADPNDSPYGPTLFLKNPYDTGSGIGVYAAGIYGYGSGGVNLVNDSLVYFVEDSLDSWASYYLNFLNPSVMIPGNAPIPGPITCMVPVTDGENQVLLTSGYTDLVIAKDLSSWIPLEQTLGNFLAQTENTITWDIAPGPDNSWTYTGVDVQNQAGFGNDVFSGYFTLSNLTVPVGNDPEFKSGGETPELELITVDSIGGTPVIIFTPKGTQTKMRTSTHKEPAGNVSVFPNPTNGKLTIRSDSGISQVQLADFSGKQVLIQKFPDETTVSLELPGNLPAGIYFLKITTSTGMVVKKIQKTTP